MKEIGMGCVKDVVINDLYVVVLYKFLGNDWWCLWDNVFNKGIMIEDVYVIIFKRVKMLLNIIFNWYILFIKSLKINIFICFYVCLWMKDLVIVRWIFLRMI